MSDSDNNLTRFRATIQYDGTEFHGSQLQPDVRTVQGEMESALSRLLNVETRVDFAGRTDTGVHALAQEVAFSAPSTWEPDDLGRGLSALLPADITTGGPRAAGEGFHPRFDAERRRYLYAVSPGELGHTPFLRRSTWRTRFDGFALTASADGIETLNRIASTIVGDRDFGRFAKSGQPARGSRCSVDSAGWRRHPTGHFVFEIVADRFLHHMVRYLVGTTIEIAAGRRAEEDFGALLAGEPASRPVFPAPPRGLYLSAVRYAGEWNRTGDLPW
ncbi:MAG: tRNA pseudouridine(38-40) synthase TruA [Gemmatimonadota bacterium]